MILLVNQHIVPVFTDVINAFVRSGEKTKYFTGLVEAGRTPIDSEAIEAKSVSYKRNSTFSRFLSWTMFSIHYFFFLVFGQRPDRILVVTNPPFAPLITSVVARFRKIPFWVLIYDLYPEALSQSGFVKPGGFIFRRWQYLNRVLLSRAEKIFTLSESMKEATYQYTSKDKIKVIGNWADVEYIKPIPKKNNTFIRQHLLEDKVIVMYSGNMGLTHDLESLINAAELLKEENEIIFVLIGEGGQRQKLVDMAKKRQMSNVMFLPYQDAVKFPQAMAAADIGVVTLGTGAEGISVPSKTYVNMAAGLSLLVISPPLSELTRIVEFFGIGYCVEPGRPEILARHIKFQLEDRAKLNSFKERSRQASLQFTPANAQLYVKDILDKGAVD